MENLTLGKILKIFRKNIRIISLFALGGLIIGILYALLIFKPLYSASAKLLIKNEPETNFVTELGQTNDITSLTREGNPTLTQITIITSETVARKVWDEISKKYKFTDDPQIGIKLMQGAVAVINPIGTDIIQITANWQDPKIAQDIANAYVNTYMAMNLDNAKKGIVQSKVSIDRQLDEAQRDLSQTRDQIKNFRLANSTVDIDTEAESIVGQISALENRYNDILSTAGAEANRANLLAGKLGLDWQKAVDSVALGHNDLIAQLQNRLGQAQEDYAGFASKYAPTHPTMTALSARINNIKTELSAQIKQTIGNQSTNLVISDPVRTGILEDLARSEASYRGFLAQSGIIRSALGALESRKATIPIKQLILAKLAQDEANCATIVNTLKAKQVEATIRESEIIGNISIIDSPAIPMFPTFPSKFWVAVIFAVLGTSLGMLGTMIEYLLKDAYEDTEELEEELKAPVLGQIPWLNKQTYNEPEALLAVDNNSSFYSLAYQKIVSSLRIRGYKSGVKTLAFTSTEYTK